LIINQSKNKRICEVKVVTSKAVVWKTKKVWNLLLQAPRLLRKLSSQIEGHLLVKSIKVNRIYQWGWADKSLPLWLMILQLLNLSLKSLSVQNTPLRRLSKLLALLLLNIKFRLARKTKCCCFQRVSSRCLMWDPCKLLPCKRHRWLRWLQPQQINLRRPLCTPKKIKVFLRSRKAIRAKPHLLRGLAKVEPCKKDLEEIRRRENCRRRMASSSPPHLTLTILNIKQVKVWSRREEEMKSLTLTKIKQLRKLSPSRLLVPLNKPLQPQRTNLLQTYSKNQLRATLEASQVSPTSRETLPNTVQAHSNLMLPSHSLHKRDNRLHQSRNGIRHSLRPSLNRRQTRKVSHPVRTKWPAREKEIRWTP
jgi:hypothetical protein